MPRRPSTRTSSDGSVGATQRVLGAGRFEADYAPDRRCYLRNIATNTTTAPEHNPHRPFSAAELERREQLRAYLDKASEDQLIEETLLPLFRQLGFHRVTVAGHKDKALEYGKDV